MPCLALELEAEYLPPFKKINRIELNEEYAFITVTVLEAPMMDMQGYIGVDRNTTGHVAAVGNPATGKVWKLGKECPHVHEKYKNTRKELQKQGRYKEVEKIGSREKRIIKDIDHKVSKKIVDIAVQNACGIKLGQLDGMRNNGRQASSFKYSLHGRSFYQIQKDMEHKAKLNGVPVIYAAPQYTGRQCSRCSLLGNRNG